MRIADVPEHLIIVGGGFVACEFAHIFSSLGSRVTLLIRGSTLLRGHDDDITMRFTDIAGKKWEIRSHHEVTDARAVGGRRRDPLQRRLDVARRCAAGRDGPSAQR